MKKFYLFFAFFLMVGFLSGCGNSSVIPVDNTSVVEPEVVEDWWPAIGDTYNFDDKFFDVVKVSGRSFEYETNGEELILMNLEDEDFVVNHTASKGTLYKVDPTKPSMTVGGQELLTDWPVGPVAVLQFNPEW